MKIYSKETVQHVTASHDECWSFFSSPRNLQKITPTDMGLKSQIMMVNQSIQAK
jgi:ligand-binding SRPBCC domain-containing protein